MSSAPEAGTEWPTVSVVMPVKNEERHLEESVAAVLSQEYPGDLDVCIAVAPSTDATRSVADQIARQRSNVSVVDNPTGLTPAGLNRAIRSSNGEVIVRVDGHSRLSPGYVVRAVETMARTGAVNVGGIQHARGTTPFEQAVAAAMSSRFGTGGSRFHLGGAEGPVDTVYLGVFRRDALEAVGLFDEGLTRNQDYELNIRLRGAGGTVWFDPQLSVGYHPRGTVSSLAKQYFEYGWWKSVVARRHPHSLKVRQVAPVAATVGLAGSVLLARRSRAARFALASYAVSTLASAYSASGRRVAIGVRLLLIFPVMHLSWGSGFVASSLRSSLRSLNNGSRVAAR